MKTKACLIIIAVVFSFSCKKEPSTYCWECVSQRHSLAGGPSTIRNTFCDKTEAEIKQYERDNNFQRGSPTDILTVVTTCTRK